MIITYGGLTSLRIQVGDTTLAVNPISKKSKYEQMSFGSDIALLSINHSDANGIDSVSRGEKVPFVISGPGEYETRGVSIKGFSVETVYEAKTYINTVYHILMEGMHLCFLGAISKIELPPELLEDIDEVDILFVPTGKGLLSAKDAHKLIVSLEPRISIPMYTDADALTLFLKESGKSTIRPIDKYVVKKKDCLEQQGSLVVLGSN